MMLPLVRTATGPQKKVNATGWKAPPTATPYKTPGQREIERLSSTAERVYLMVRAIGALLKASRVKDMIFEKKGEARERTLSRRWSPKKRIIYNLLKLKNQRGSYTGNF